MAGVRAEFFSFRHAHQNRDNWALIDEMRQSMHEAGATWLRATAVASDHVSSPGDEHPFGIWMEGWRERPQEEAEFDPPLTYAKDSESEYPDRATGREESENNLADTSTSLRGSIPA